MSGPPKGQWELLRAVDGLREQVARLVQTDRPADRDTGEELDGKLASIRDALLDGSIGSGIWHDFGNLLYGILAYAEGVRSGASDDDPTYGAAVSVVDTARQAIGLVRRERDELSPEQERGRKSSVRRVFCVSGAGQRRQRDCGEKGAGATGCVLVIDVDQAIRQVTRDMLELLGRYAVTFRDVEEGLAYYRVHRAEVDLVILDAENGSRGGLGCVDLFRRIDPEARVLLAVGDRSPQTERSLRAAGANASIPRPFTLRQLSEALDRATR